ncbi:metallophosphoesterase family protein [Flavobacterium sp.]|uniref:metallophosphoesterase family protein n=1 Tax=Flavobacterium sp. TaxID=239 RepID=UPI00286CF29E|nr:metallophosphoesterase family protein [Flavobacterium sp.]
MNKIGIISDIHGNYEALKTILAELDAMNVTEIYCLGDVVGYYSQVNECCDELRKRNIPCLMGNHDWYMASGGFCPRSKSVNDCLVYQRKVITQENIDWLRTFEVQRFVGSIHMVHGGWADPIDEYLVEPNAEYFSKIEGKIFVSGHTHFQSLHTFGDKVYCNPGSVGMPRDNDPRAAFATFDGEFTLHRIEYNMQVVFDLMDQAGFNDYYYGCLKTGARNLCKL